MRHTASASGWFYGRDGPGAGAAAPLLLRRRSSRAARHGSCSSFKPAQRLLLDGRRGRTRAPRREVLVGRRRQQVRGHPNRRRRRLHVAEERRRRPPPGDEDGRARGGSSSTLSPSAGKARLAPTSRSTSPADGGRSNTGPDRAAATSCSTRAVTPASRAPKSSQVRSSEASRRSGSLIGEILPAQDQRASPLPSHAKASVAVAHRRRTPRQPLTFLNPHGFRHPDTPAGAGDRAPAQALRRSAHARWFPGRPIPP
jgi:hypothetical protein